MILDIEVQHKSGFQLDALNISYFNREGDIAYHRMQLEPARDGYIWDYATGPLDTPMAGYQSWDGQPVAKIKTSKINKYTIEEILQRRRAELDRVLEFNIPNKYIIDIETEITDGFPSPVLALNKVTAIAIANCSEKRVTVLGLKDMSEMDHDKIQSDIDKHFESKYPDDRWGFRYVKMESEYDMLYTFFAKLIHKMPCITGWNVIGFDWEYLINRAERLKIDPNMAGRLKGKQRLPEHKLVVDYLDIVKKWDRVIKIKENYKLDYIGERATGIAKVKYPGTLKDLYDKDFLKFIFYNAVDTILVHYIDQELNTMQTFFKLASIAQVEINRAFSPVWVQEALMTREYMNRKQVMVDTDKSEVTQQHFVGAYVKEPVLGLHEWVTCFDFASLYPNTMMQFNISPENYLGESPSGIAEEGQIVCANKRVFDNTKDSCLRTILQELYGKRKETKGKKLDINKEIDFLKRHLQAA